MNAESIRATTETIANEPSLLQRQFELGELAARLDPGDWPLALQSLKESAHASARPLRGDLIGYWFEHDLSAARTWLGALPMEERHAAFTAAARVWVDRDAADLIAWTRASLARGETDFLSRIRDALCESLARVDAESAAALLFQIPAAPSGARAKTRFSVNGPGAIRGALPRISSASRRNGASPWLVK